MFAQSARLSVLVLICLALAATSGCNSSGGQGTVRSIKTYEVKGKVVQADGTPLPGGTVKLVPIPKKGSEDEATGEIQADGTFVLGTRKAGDGAVAGEYKVRIEPVSPRVIKDKIQLPEYPSKYRDEDASGLTATIKEGVNELPPFELK